MPKSQHGFQEVLMQSRSKLRFHNPSITTQQASNATLLGACNDVSWQSLGAFIGIEQMMQNQLAAQAAQSGAFGGGREGVQQAELQGRALEAMGRAQAQGFQTALGAAQRQQQVGLAAGQQLGQMGQLQQQMAQGDINQLMAAGGVQRQLAQAALDAQRQSTLQQQYEPYQRAEFLANLYAAGPKTQSGVTMGTTPTTSPLAQAVGTGIGAFAAYQGANQ